MDMDSPVKKGKLASLILALLFIAAVTISAGSLVEDIPSDQIGIKQAFGSGELTYWTTPGMKAQLFGDVTYYNKAAEFGFSSKIDHGMPVDESLKITFNDAGTAKISGSTTVEMPLDAEHLKEIRTRYNSTDALISRLIRTTIEKAVFTSGSLMSSTESFGEKRNALISYIEDQAKNGIYATKTREERIKDAITGEMKTITLTERIADPKAPGGWKRQEESAITKFGIKFYNFAVDDISYDKQVLAQISKMRDAKMRVQTSKAKAKEAEQNLITTQKEGEAAVAKEQWKQKEALEVAKGKANRARELMEINAQGKLNTAKLDRQAAEEEKAATIARATGKAKAAKLLMVADGALDKKLAAFVKVNANYAAAIADHKGAQTVVISGDDHNGNAGAAAGTIQGLNQLIQLQTVNTAKALGLNTAVSSRR